MSTGAERPFGSKASSQVLATHVCGRGRCGGDDSYPDTHTPDIGYHYSVNEDSDYDGLPDSWEYYWFGSYGHTGSELDAVGNTLSSDYQNYASGTVTNDPNIIRFSIEVPNNYVTNSSATMGMDVIIGTAAYYSVLVDSTNFTGASWTSYTSSNLTASLGSTQGWHEIWVGLKGPAPGASVTWVWKRLKLDTTAPSIVITNPPSATVTMPMIQVNGYSREDLDSISCDVSNVLGLVTNLDAGVTHRFHDTNTWEYTTNFFECLDVPLTNGVNVITIHATDLAGNVTTLATNITLDYTGKTAPAVQLTWPQDGMELCGTNFTIRGQVDDPTVSVLATVTYTNGDTDTLYGMVERNGRFWVDDVPLNSGTNQVSITFSNAASQTTVTNFDVTQSAMTLTMDAVSDPMQLWQPTISLSGTVSDPSVSIQVNGVAGTNNGDGTWSAGNVPVNEDGEAIFDVKAIPPGGGDPDMSVNMNKPARLYVKEYTEQDGGEANATFNTPNGIWSIFWNASGNCHWSDGTNGDGSLSYSAFEDNVDFEDGFQNITHAEKWSFPASHWPTVSQGTSIATNFNEWMLYGTPGNSSSSETNPWPPQIVLEHCIVSPKVGIDFGWPYHWIGSPFSQTPENTGQYKRSADATMELQTGGRARSASHRLNSLYCLSASAAKLLEDYAYPSVDASGNVSWGSKYDPPTTNIPNENIDVDQLPLGSDGKQWRGYEDGTTRDVTPRVKGVDFYTFTISQQKYELFIQAETSSSSCLLEAPEVVPAARFCVGEKIKFSPVWVPETPSGILEGGSHFSWNLEGVYANDHTNAVSGGSAPNSSEVYFANDNLLNNEILTNCWWYYGGYPAPGGFYAATLDASFTLTNGQQFNTHVDGFINMFRPKVEGYFHSSPVLVLNHQGLGGPWLDTIPQGYFGAALLSAFDGEVGVTQLINGYATNQSIWADSSNTYQLDRDLSTNAAEFLRLYDVDSTSKTGSGFGWNDEPAIGCAGNRSILHYYFRCYIRFKPSRSDGIYVTVGLVTWHDTGETHLGPNGLGGNDYYPLPPPQIVTSDQNDTAFDSSDFDFSDFPFWMDVFTKHVR